MKNLRIKIFSIVAIALASCGASGDNPGHSYMPDMYYSRAYETFGYNNVGNEHENLKNRGINYNGIPVAGTIARGDRYNYHLTADSTGLNAAQTLKNPLDTTRWKRTFMEWWKWSICCKACRPNWVWKNIKRRTLFPCYHFWYTYNG
jgi:hypothetical protein